MAASLPVGAGETPAGVGEVVEQAAYLRLVGRRMKSRRVLLGLNQDALAAASGVSRVTLGSIERGDHAASLMTYRKVARALRWDVGELVEERSP